MRDAGRPLVLSGAVLSLALLSSGLLSSAAACSSNDGRAPARDDGPRGGAATGAGGGSTAAGGSGAATGGAAGTGGATAASGGAIGQGGEESLPALAQPLTELLVVSGSCDSGRAVHRVTTVGTVVDYACSPGPALTLIDGGHLLTKAGSFGSCSSYDGFAPLVEAAPGRDATIAHCFLGGFSDVASAGDGLVYAFGPCGDALSGVTGNGVQLLGLDDGPALDEWCEGGAEPDVTHVVAESDESMLLLEGEPPGKLHRLTLATGDRVEIGELGLEHRVVDATPASFGQFFLAATDGPLACPGAVIRVDVETGEATIVVCLDGNPTGIGASEDLVLYVSDDQADVCPDGAGVVWMVDSGGRDETRRICPPGLLAPSDVVVP